MIIRRLSVSEHGRTRPLYEEVFSEDDKAFVDYYYEWKTRDNTIYAAEDEDGIHAMVHLNPFRIYVQGEIHTLHYIVAVATQKEYRHQGLMRSLLALAEQEMEGAGEQFTFLMPASEKIYTPFGYRYFCTQRRGVLDNAGKRGGDTEAVLRAAEIEENAGNVLREAEIEENAGDVLRTAEILEKQNAGFICRPVLPEEYDALAVFANRVLEEQYDIFVYRDAPYYERLCAEQRAQNGDVMVICRPGGDLIGTFCTSRELLLQENGDPIHVRKTDSKEECELREVILDPCYLEEGREALTEFTESYGLCKVLGYQPFLEPKREEQVPLLMGKRLCGTVFCSEWDEKKIFINEVV